jgi:hypothetical protein
LIAKADENGKLEMRYQHLNKQGDLMTGIGHSTPEILKSGKIRLHEKWQWTSGNLTKGESIIEEMDSPFVCENSLSQKNKKFESKTNLLTKTINKIESFIIPFYLVVS